MGKRPAKSYRKLQQPWTRKEYIKRIMDVPDGLKTSVFGNTSKLDFPAKIEVLAEKDGQVSARAIVAVRVALHRELRTTGEENYRLNMKAYPHHCARSHGLVGVAKAERISSGMGKGSFGFPEMRLAQIKRGNPFLEITMADDPISYGVARRGLESAFNKLPLKWRIHIEGFSTNTLHARPILPKRTKEKKGAGGNVPKELQREVK